MNRDRRQFLAGMAVLAGALPGMAAAQGSAPACYDPATLPLSQKNQRRSLGYVEASTDPQKHCAVCSFFTASAPGCGTCVILGGGPVNAGALCTSFAAKARPAG